MDDDDDDDDGWWMTRVPLSHHTHISRTHGWWQTLDLCSVVCWGSRKWVDSEGPGRASCRYIIIGFFCYFCCCFFSNKLFCQDLIKFVLELNCIVMELFVFTLKSALKWTWWPELEMGGRIASHGRLHAFHCRVAIGEFGMMQHGMRLGHTSWG